MVKYRSRKLCQGAWLKSKGFMLAAITATEKYTSSSFATLHKILVIQLRNTGQDACHGLRVGEAQLCCKRNEWTEIQYFYL